MLCQSEHKNPKITNWLLRIWSRTISKIPRFQNNRTQNAVSIGEWNLGQGRKRARQWLDLIKLMAVISSLLGKCSGLPKLLAYDRKKMIEIK